MNPVKYEFKATYIGILYYSMKQVSMCMHVCVFVSARAGLGLGHLERDSEREGERESESICTHYKL